MDLNIHDTKEQLSHALGETVVRIWGELPHDVQRDLFEATVATYAEKIRPLLAVFLHEKHSRTSASMKARAMLEPDSLGG